MNRWQKGVGIALLVVSAVTQAQMSTETYTSVDHLRDKFAKVHANEYEYWQLTAEEWELYKSLKEKSPWSIWENNATPLAILAAYSTSIAEKQRYARIEAELDQWRQHVVTEFQQLYNQEREIVHAAYEHSINDDLPIIENIGPGDHLRLFVDAGKCEARCRTFVTQALSTRAKLDIYVRGATTNADVIRWAQSASVPIERVTLQQVTLNLELNMFSTIADTAGLAEKDRKFPVLMREYKNGRLEIVVL